MTGTYCVSPVVEAGIILNNIAVLSEKITRGIKSAQDDFDVALTELEMVIRELFVQKRLEETKALVADTRAWHEEYGYGAYSNSADSMVDTIWEDFDRWVEVYLNDDEEEDE